MLSRASHPQQRQGNDHYNIRPNIKSKEPSVRHACKCDANTDSLTRTHAPIKDESTYHLAPLMNKALLTHCRRVSPLQARPSLHACTFAIWTRGVAPPQAALIAFANGAEGLHVHVYHACPRTRSVSHASCHMNTRSGTSAIGRY